MSRRRCCQILVENGTAVGTVIAVILAVVIGVVIREYLNEPRWSQRQIMYLGFVGELFLRSLKCLIIPLIISSIISALGSLDSRFAGKIGSRAVWYYLLTTFLAITLGIVLVVIIHPGQAEVGNNSTASSRSHEKQSITTPDTVLDLIRNIVPTNLVEAATHSYSTELLFPKDGNWTDLYRLEISHKMNPSTNILGLVSFSLLLGITLGSMGKVGEPMVTFFTCLSEASLKITTFIIKFTPLGVMFLILPRIVEVEDVEGMLGTVGMYTLTVLTGLFLHGLLVLPLLYFILTRKNPFRHMMLMSPALMTAFGTSSSSATLPITINCLEERVRLDARIVRFVAPIGATVNMDGTALYEAVAAIFIAQSRGVELSVVQVVIISITATAASIGAAGIPQAGLVTMVIVLNAVGLPAEDVALIFVVDWFLDRFRTFINVLGDSFGAAVIHHFCRNDLNSFDLNSFDLNSFEPGTGLNSEMNVLGGRRSIKHSSLDVSRF